MVDTMEIYHKFQSIWEYQQNINNVNAYLNKHGLNRLHSESQYKLVTYDFAEYGFQELQFIKNPYVGVYKALIRFHPKLMICPNNYISVMYPSDIDVVKKKFCEKAIKLGFSNTNLFEWKAKRVDYAVDIVIESDLIPQYIRLFKNGNIPERLLNEHTEQFFDSANNLYLVGKNYNINFYDRYETLRQKQQKSSKTYYHIERAKGRLRFEVQLKNIDSNKLKSKGLITKNSVKDFFNPNLAEYIILNHYDKIIGLGDYLPYEKALKKINSEKCTRVIASIKNEGSIYAAKEKYISQFEDKRKAEKDFSEIICKIRKKGINPVTLSKGEKLVNPRRMICEYFDNKGKTFLTRILD